VNSQVIIPKNFLQIQACAHLWKDQKYSDDYLTNGICYVADTSLNIRAIRRLLPLVQLNKQVIQRRYIYALGLAGMAAHYVGDNSTLLIGAPGVFQFSGKDNFTGFVGTSDGRIFWRSPVCGRRKQ